MGTKSLTALEEKTAQLWVSNDNLTLSVTTVYKTGKMKPSGIAAKVNRLKKKASFVQRVNELKELKKEVANVKFAISQETLLQQLDDIRRANVADYIEFVDVPVVMETESGTVTTYKQELRFKDFSKLSERQQLCIQGFKNTPRGPEIKLYGKDFSIREIAKHIGFYREELDQKSKIYDSPEAREERIREILKELSQQ